MNAQLCQVLCGPDRKPTWVSALVWWIVAALAWSYAMFSASGSFDSSQLDGAMETLRTQLADRFLEAGEVTTEYAKNFSPVDTSLNKKSISLEVYQAGQLVSSQGGSSDGADIEPPITGFRVFTISGYGGYLEIGTSKMRAQPYIQPAFEMAVQELQGSMEGMV